MSREWKALQGKLDKASAIREERERLGDELAGLEIEIFDAVTAIERGGCSVVFGVRGKYGRLVWDCPSCKQRNLSSQRGRGKCCECLAEVVVLSDPDARPEAVG